jgi:hypothetical protein
MLPEGSRLGRRWADPLRRGLSELLAAVAWIRRGFGSAGQEAAPATSSFRDPRRTAGAHKAAGGVPLRASPDLLVRRAGLRLGRLSERLAMSLESVERRACEQIESIPTFTNALRERGMTDFPR